MEKAKKERKNNNELGLIEENHLKSFWTRAVFVIQYCLNPVFKLVKKHVCFNWFDWFFMMIDQNLAMYTVFVQGIRIWGQKMLNFKARREKSRKTHVNVMFSFLLSFLKLSVGLLLDYLFVDLGGPFWRLFWTVLDGFSYSFDGFRQVFQTVVDGFSGWMFLNICLDRLCWLSVHTI